MPNTVNTLTAKRIELSSSYNLLEFVIQTFKQIGFPKIKGGSATLIHLVALATK
jgi:hypothetical protein